MPGSQNWRDVGTVGEEGDLQRECPGRTPKNLMDYQSSHRSCMLPIQVSRKNLKLSGNMDKVPWSITPPQSEGSTSICIGSKSIHTSCYDFGGKESIEIIDKCRAITDNDFSEDTGLEYLWKEDSYKQPKIEVHVEKHTG